jgi:hypothetical protein
MLLLILNIILLWVLLIDFLKLSKIQLKNSVVWFNFLEKIIEKYNQTPHNGIKPIAPDEAMDKENYNTINNLNFWKAVKNNEVIDKKTKVNIGDFVRLQINKNNLTNYSKKVFQVEEINGNNIKLNNDKN